LLFVRKGEDGLRTCIPSKSVKSVLHGAHDRQAHPGIENTFASVREHFYIPYIATQPRWRSNAQGGTTNGPKGTAVIRLSCAVVADEETRASEETEILCLVSRRSRTHRFGKHRHAHLHIVYNILATHICIYCLHAKTARLCLQAVFYLGI